MSDNAARKIEIVMPMMAPGLTGGGWRGLRGIATSFVVSNMKHYQGKDINMYVGLQSRTTEPSGNLNMGRA